jgi:hypothetical protein
MNFFDAGRLARFNRRQAALFHLGTSALVAATIVAVMLLLWYPSPWFGASGGDKLLMLLIGVDVVLGPLLTFVVFDPTKKSLVYDLAVIVMLQVAALIYGVNVMAAVRPAYIVYLDGAFEVVAAKEVKTSDMADAKLPEFQSMPMTGPRLAAARVSADPGVQLKMAMESDGDSDFGGPDYAVYPRFYIPYATASREAAGRGTSLASLAGKSPEKAEAVAGLVRSSGKPVEALVYLPLRTRTGELTIVLTKAEGDVVGVLPLYPR